MAVCVSLVVGSPAYMNCSVTSRWPTADTPPAAPEPLRAFHTILAEVGVPLPRHVFVAVVVGASADKERHASQAGDIDRAPRALRQILDPERKRRTDPLSGRRSHAGRGHGVGAGGERC